MTFLSVIRSGCGTLSNVEFESFVKNLSTATTQVSAFDNVIKKFTFKLSDNIIKVNDIPFTKLEPRLRLGKFASVCDELKISHNLSLADELQYQKLFKNNIPDFRIDEMDNAIKINKTKYPELDLKVSSIDDFNEKASPIAKARVTNALNKIKSIAVSGAVIVGVGVGLYLTGDLLENLINATKARNGCFLHTTVNSKTTFCKLSDHSCNSNQANGTNPCLGPIKFNTTLWITFAIDHKTTNKTLYNKLLEISGLTELNLSSGAMDSVAFEKLSNYYYNNNDEFTKIDLGQYKCAAGECVACDPSEGITSIKYFNTATLADNMQVRCVRDSSVLDTLVDLAVEQGIDLFGGVGSVFGSLRNVILLIVMIFVIIFSGGLALRFYNNRKTSEPEYEPLINE